MHVLIVSSVLYLYTGDQQFIKDDPLLKVRTEWHERYQAVAHECKLLKRSECEMLKEELQKWITSQVFDSVKKNYWLSLHVLLKNNNKRKKVC
jgi:hypothetical protein